MPGWLTGSLLALVLACALFIVAAAVAFTAGRQAHARSLAAASAIAEARPNDRAEEHSMAGTFAAAIACVDGRVQAPVADWVKINCNVTFVDMITIPGPDRALTHGHEERKGHVHEYVTISVNAHGSRVIAVAGHHDCAAYPVSREEHIASIRDAVQTVARWHFEAPVRVVGLWVNEMWMIEVVADTAKESF